MKLKRNVIIGGLALLGFWALFELINTTTNKSINEDDDYEDDEFNYVVGKDKSGYEDDYEDDDYYDDDNNDKDDYEEEYYSCAKEIPDGYVELYDGSIARLSDVEDIDDLADPTDYYR